jgi:hypothetical protein
MDPELLSLDDLPADARALLDAADQDETALRAHAEEQIDQIRARADRAVADLQGKVDEDVRARRQRLYRELKPLQDKYAKDGKLDEALAIRERLRGLRGKLLQAQADPGNLTAFQNEAVGSSRLFDVTGSADGIVWGTDVYTGDSRLAAVAVHAGVLYDGERGLVRVTFVDTLNVAFIGSERNGVWSQSYGPWPVGYRVERA